MWKWLFILCWYNFVNSLKLTNYLDHFKLSFFFSEVFFRGRVRTRDVFSQPGPYVRRFFAFPQEEEGGAIAKEDEAPARRRGGGFTLALIIL